MLKHTIYVCMKNGEETGHDVDLHGFEDYDSASCHIAEAVQQSVQKDSGDDTLIVDMEDCVSAIETRSPGYQVMWSTDDDSKREDIELFKVEVVPAGLMFGERKIVQRIGKWSISVGDMEIDICDDDDDDEDYVQDGGDTDTDSDSYISSDDEEYTEDSDGNMVADDGLLD